MTHASLFSGIGGFDLAAEWAGWTNMFNCEIDAFCRRVLKFHFPNAIQYENIRTTDFSIWRKRIDVLTGGFPCQPFSVAGKRKGTDDDRYLWPEMLRAIREIRPSWVVGENVRGFVNWSAGMVFDTVFSDLEALGYEVQPFILPACAVGAPHRRDRVWIVAHAASLRLPQRDMFCSQRCENRCDENELAESSHVEVCWEKFQTQSPVCCGNDGLPARLDGITFPSWRMQSVKAYGNAIVPQVFYQIAETINEYERL